MQRKQTAVVLAGAAAVAALLGAASFLPAGEPKGRVEVGEKVLPGFAAKAPKVELVTVTTAEETYHLKSTPTGWVMPEKGSFPVEAERVAQLTRALIAIAYAKPMTREDKKFDRIGLGDPAQGGTGALVELGDGAGANVAKLLVGYRDARSYVRMPDDLQAWSVSGDVLPPLQRGARWLDLNVAPIAAADIAEVQVRPQAGPFYRLVPADATGPKFNLAPPYDTRRVVAGYAPTMAASALIRLAPIDVALAVGIATGAPLAEHITHTKSGVAIVVRSWKANGRGWVTIAAAVGETATPQASARALSINTRAAGWAFALSDLDWRNFSTPLAALVQ